MYKLCERKYVGTSCISSRPFGISTKCPLMGCNTSLFVAGSTRNLLSRRAPVWKTDVYIQNAWGVYIYLMVEHVSVKRKRICVMPCRFINRGYSNGVHPSTPPTFPLVCFCILITFLFSFRNDVDNMGLHPEVFSICKIKLRLWVDCRMRWSFKKTMLAKLITVLPPPRRSWFHITPSASPNH